jgi:cytochrome c
VKFRRKMMSSTLSLALITATCAGLAGPAQATITNAPGYYHLRNAQSTTCVDAQNAPSGTRVLMWRCLNTEYEEWQKVDVPISPDHYDHCACTFAPMFVNHATGLCLAVDSATPYNGTPVIQADCNTSDDRQWWSLPQASDQYGGRILTFIAHNVALDVDGGRSADGTPLQVWTDVGSHSQRWGPPAGCCYDPPVDD